MVAGSVDGDGAAVGVAQHVGLFLTVAAIVHQPGLVERIVDGLRTVAEGQRVDWSGLWLVVLFDHLTIGERAVTGNPVECKRQYPLVVELRGLTLVDNLLDLDVAGAEERLAVDDGEFVQSLVMGHRLALVACDDAGVNPVEDALCIDRIFVQLALCLLTLVG